MEIVIIDINDNVVLKKECNFLDSVMRVLVKYKENIKKDSFVAKITKGSYDNCVFINESNIENIDMFLKIYKKEK